MIKADKRVKQMFIRPNEKGRSFPSMLYLQTEDGQIYEFTSHLDNGWAGFYEVSESTLQKITNPPTKSK